MADKLLRFFSQSSVIFVVTIILVFVAELAAREIVRMIRWDAPVYMLQYTDQNIRELYNTDQPNRYHAMLAEGWRDDRGNWLVYEPFLEFQTQSRSGKYFSITDERFRAYSGGPRATNVDGLRIFVYGGSTTFGSGVLDKETVPFFIQKHLRSHGFGNVNVFNFGVTGYYSTQEMMLFERHIREGNAPDIAIFIDGLNDFYMCQVPDKSGKSWLIERALASSSSVHSLKRIIAQRSNVLKLIRIYQGHEFPGKRDGNPCGRLENAEKVIQRLDANRRMISAIGKRLNIHTIFVQQPVPTYSYDNSTRPVPIYNKEKFGLHKNSMIGYPIMARKRNSGELFSDDVLWLEKATINQNMYVDLVHYSPQFSEEIGRQISNHLVAKHSRLLAAN